MDRDRPQSWVVRSAVPGFLPSVSAFRFTNSFDVQPLLALRLPGLPWGLGIGDASRGLCGGMIFAVRDLFEAGLAVPPDVEPPRRGSPLYGYFVRRLLASFDLPRGVARYYGLMRAADAYPQPRRGGAWWPGASRPDRRSSASASCGSAADPRGSTADGPGSVPNRPGSAPGRPGSALGRLGVGLRSLADEWPRIRLDLDSGRLAPVGVITVHSADPLQLGLNHQVLAYAYDQVDMAVTLRVYDPNTPLERADDVTMSFDLASAGGAPGRVRISHSIAIGGRPVRAFFHSRYRWADPRPALRAHAAGSH
ncbi:hypothetical protein [Frankia sp. ACN1ag]|uniref:hypothetical protein n=1 Tax=Frankia sp. ACN1ag TaxID=102891 RepID=UPI0006DC4532|nr:hypothetical protein [Frankia sp. ACN1ag]KQC40300.1 hypothetical protein UK82_01405 [Frankia sp. ACN1ag]